MKRSGTERDMKQRRYISNIEIIKEDVTIVQEQVRTCQQHLTQLRQQSMCSLVIKSVRINVADRGDLSFSSIIIL